MICFIENSLAFMTGIYDWHYSQYSGVLNKIYDKVYIYI